MNLRLTHVGILSVCALAFAAPACSDDPKSPILSTGGSAGSVGVGGTPGVGGVAVGGSAGTAVGGTPGVGGMAGLGGVGGAVGGRGGLGGLGGNAGSGAEAGEGGEGGDMGCDLPFEGGEAGAGPMAVNTFDTPGSQTGWQPEPSETATGNVGDSSLRREPTEGLTCEGSLEVTMTFSEYGAGEFVNPAINFGPTDWTGYSTYHLALRFEEPDTGNLDHLNRVQVFVRSDGYANYNKIDLSPEDFDDFEWHEVMIDMTGGTVTVLADVNKIGVQVAVEEMAPAGGPAAPPTTVMYIDDIWVE